MSVFTSGPLGGRCTYRFGNLWPDRFVHRCRTESAPYAPATGAVGGVGKGTQLNYERQSEVPTLIPQVLEAL